MSRPASNIDIEMIKAGQMIIETEGADAVTIRNVCSLASANTGLFNYYFSTKENFFIKLLDNIYEDFCEFIKKGGNNIEITDKNIDPLCRLRYCLDKMLNFAINKEKLLVSIFYDVLLKNKCLLEKIGHCYLNRHILVGLIEECINYGHFSTKLPALEVFAIFILGGFGFQHSVFMNGYDIEHKEERAKLRRERVNIILRGLLNKGDVL